MSREVRKSQFRAGLIGVACATIGLMAATSLPAQTNPQANPPAERPSFLQQFSESLDELAARVSPSVVQVIVTGYRPVEKKDEEEASEIARARSLGSGVIVDPEGYIITNAHVVKGAQRVRVLLTPPTPAGDSQLRESLGIGEHIPPKDAKIVGVSTEHDLALLKIEGKGYASVPFADYTKLKKGQLVLAFGNPEGLENSVTMGVVSAVARQADPSNPNVYIQTDAPINPGNSGGPLIDTDGRLVGIATFILTESGGSQGLGFAIPSSVVRFVYEELRKYGRVHHAAIGVGLQDITPNLAAGLGLQRQEGVIVCDVDPDGPAAHAGVQIQDILLSLDGRRIGSVPIAEMIVSTRSAGQNVRAVLLRGSQRVELSIPVTDQQDEAEKVADLVDPQKSLVVKLGIFGVEIDDKLAEDLPDLRIPSGVIVAAMSADSAGVSTGLEPADVIHGVNGKHIETLDELREAVNAIPSGGAGVLQVERDSKLMYLTFELD